MRSALTALDDRLVEVLSAGAIRLVRTSWLLQQPPEFRIQWRQQLEALERGDEGLSPLLSPEEAVSLVRQGDRSVGVLSYAWLSPGDPDPAGRRLEVLRRSLAKLPNIAALFWDYASLYQHPPGGLRTKDEDASFEEGIKIMGDLYASAIGTTVLQLKEIPPRPSSFDGALCMFGLAKDSESKSLGRA